MFETIVARLRAFVQRHRIDEEIDEEVRFHLEMEIEANRARGMAPSDARRVALLDLGGDTQTREAVRSARAPWYDSIVRDVRHGLRASRRYPGFTAVAIATLALGTGANTAIFSLVDAILFRPLPYGSPGQLVWVMGYDDNQHTHVSTIPRETRDEVFRRRQGFRAVSCSRWMGPSFTRGTGAQETVLRAIAVCPDLLDVLDVRPVLGRGFSIGEGAAGHQPVALLSHAAWLKHYAADPGVIDRIEVFSGRQVQIIGVLPERFVLPPMLGITPPDLLVPQAIGPRDAVLVIGRLRSGVSFAQAQAELDGLDRGVQAAAAGKPWRRRVEVVPLQTAVFERARPLSIVLLAGSTLVLLLAAVNVANLLLARGSWREREMAIRASLGAGRLQLIRHLLLEGLLLSSAGGGVGLLLAWSVFDALRARTPSRLFTALPGGINGRVLLFTVLVSTLAGLAAAVLPAIRSTGPRLGWALKEGRSAIGAPIRTARGAALVAAQMAVVVVLLTGAALMLGSLARALTTDLGVRVDQVIQVDAAPPRSVARNAAGATAFQREVISQVAAAPGVERVAGVCTLTLGGRNVPWGAMLRDALPERRGSRYLVTADYFHVLGIPVRHGRTFTQYEVDTGAAVAIVNESAALQLWPGQRAVGQRFQTGTEPSREVVGVVGDTRDAFYQAISPALYLPPDPAVGGRMDILALVRGDLAAAQTAVRARLTGSLSPSRLTVTSLAEAVRATTVAERFQTLLLAVFAGLALTLAAVGVSGIVGYTVSRRAHEIGVRLVLGARPWRVVALIVRQSLGPVVVGGVVGLLLARGVCGLLRSLLFQVAPTDPAAFGAAVASLLLVAVPASVVPARRAARVNPIDTLRAE